MSELTQIARVSARGGFFLFLGQFSSTIMMALSSILIARLLGPEEYGIYVIVFTIPSLLVVLSDLGISPALTRFSAYYHVKGDHRKVADLIRVAIFFKSAFSLILSLSMLLLSEGIATYILRRPEIGPLLRIASLYLIGDALLSSMNSIFIGLDKMGITSLLLNVQALTRVAVSPLLIIVGLGVIGATLGSGLGYILAATIGALILLLQIIPTLKKSSSGTCNSNLSQGLKEMISYGTPLYFSVLVGTIFLQFRTILLTLFVSNSDIGNYGIAMNFDVLMNVLIYPITTSLFPAFSKLNIENNRNEIEKMFKLAVKYAALIIIPASLALSILSADAIDILYGSQYRIASIFLSLYILSYLYAAMGSSVIGPLINGQGYTRTSLKIGIFSAVISISMASILIPLYGVIGLIISLLITPLISTSYALHIVHQKFKLSIEPKDSLKILAASLLSAILVYILAKLINLTSPIWSLGVGGLIYILSFLVLTPILGVISEDDIENLKHATSELPIIRTLAIYILSIEKKILELKTQCVNTLANKS